MNFYLEIALTVSTFLSSFLIITIEKNWWGGYLTSEKNSFVARNFHEWQLNGKKMKVPNPTYLFENTIRLIVIGTSITFFLLMSFMDLVQTLITLVLIMFNRIKYAMRSIISSSPMSYDPARGR